MIRLFPALFLAACTALTPAATEPAGAAASIVLPNDAPLGVSVRADLAPGIYRIRTSAQCQDAIGKYALSTNYHGGCTALVNLIACAPAPGGGCDCVGYPETGSGPGCDDIAGGGISQGVEWR